MACGSLRPRLVITGRRFMAASTRASAQTCCATSSPVGADAFRRRKATPSYRRICPCRTLAEPVWLDRLDPLALGCLLLRPCLRHNHLNSDTLDPHATTPLRSAGTLVRRPELRETPFVRTCAKSDEIC